MKHLYYKRHTFITIPIVYMKSSDTLTINSCIYKVLAHKDSSCKIDQRPCVLCPVEGHSGWRGFIHRTPGDLNVLFAFSSIAAASHSCSMLWDSNCDHFSFLKSSTNIGNGKLVKQGNILRGHNKFLHHKAVYKTVKLTNTGFTAWNLHWLLQCN